MQKFDCKYLGSGIHEARADVLQDASKLHMNASPANLRFRKLGGCDIFSVLYIYSNDDLTTSGAKILGHHPESFQSLVRFDLRIPVSKPSRHVLSEPVRPEYQAPDARIMKFIICYIIFLN